MYQFDREVDSIKCNRSRKRGRKSSSIQRQVPQGGEVGKPIPYTGSYNPHSNDKVFYKADFPRSKFNFGANTRYEVLKEYNPQYAGTRIISVQDNNGNHVNVEGIQLDHKVSWDSIANAMDAHNKQANQPWYYTVEDARKYYNDQTNLHPVLGALNASAGAEGALAGESLNSKVSDEMGEIQKSWMNLQTALTAIQPALQEEQIPILTEELYKISMSINNLTNNIVDNDWS